MVARLRICALAFCVVFESLSLRGRGVGCDDAVCDALHLNCAGASHGKLSCAKEEARTLDA